MSVKGKETENLKWTTRLLEISIGVLLGDCSIQKNKSKSTERYRLKFLQGAQHKEYIYHLHAEFKDYVLCQPHFDSKRNTYSFQTVFHSEFTKLAEIFLNENYKKSIKPFFLENPISPVSLAYWFMDDGGLLSYNKDYPRRGLVLNTHGFSFSEVNVLSLNLNSAYNLGTWVKDNKNKPIIAVSGKKHKERKELIFPHIIESMRYKLTARNTLKV